MSLHLVVISLVCSIQIKLLQISLELSESRVEERGVVPSEGMDCSESK